MRLRSSASFLHIIALMYGIAYIIPTPAENIAMCNRMSSSSLNLGSRSAPAI